MLLPAAGALEKEQAQYRSDESHLDSSATAWLYMPSVDVLRGSAYGGFLTAHGDT